MPLIRYRVTLAWMFEENAFGALLVELDPCYASYGIELIVILLRKKIR